MSDQMSTRVSGWLLSACLGVGAVIVTACIPVEETAATNPEVEILTMYVGPERTDCVGVAPQECLQVRYGPDDEYELFYSDIAGFDYEPGYTYELLVQKTPIPNPPADASSIRWELIEVVSQTAVSP